MVTPLDEIRGFVTDADVVEYIRSIKNPVQYTEAIKKKLQDVIKNLGSSNHPAFRYFFQRRNAWHTYLKPQLVKFLTDAAYGKANTDFIIPSIIEPKMKKLLSEKEINLFKEKKDRRKVLDQEIRKARKKKDTEKEKQLMSQVETEFSEPIIEDLDSDKTAKFFDFLRKEFISNVIRKKTVRTKQSDEMNRALIKMAMMKMSRPEEHYA